MRLLSSCAWLALLLACLSLTVPCAAQRMGRSPASKTWDHKDHVYPVYDIRTEFAEARQYARDQGHFGCCGKFSDDQAKYLASYERSDSAALASYKSGRLRVGPAPLPSGKIHVRYGAVTVSHSRPSVRPGPPRPWWSYAGMVLAFLFPVFGYLCSVRRRRTEFLRHLQAANPASYVRPPSRPR